MRMLNIFESFAQHTQYTVMFDLNNRITENCIFRVVVQIFAEESGETTTRYFVWTVFVLLSWLTDIHRELGTT